MTFAEMLEIVRRTQATLSQHSIVLQETVDDLKRLEKALLRLRDREDRRPPDESDKEAVWDDFREWSGDFPPESEQQIEDYIESSLSPDFTDDEARTWLREAMATFEPPNERNEDHESRNEPDDSGRRDHLDPDRQHGRRASCLGG